MPIIADPNPARAGSMFTGLQGVWRTTDNGGDQAYLEANCPEFTTPGDEPGCGDWVELGGNPDGRLTTSARGSRSGGTMAAVARAGSDTGTLWAATSTGRVFISKNADAADASAVSFTRLDSLAANAPNRFVSGIFVDPKNANHAWISYSGYGALTPATPGHLFSVVYNPDDGTATWTSLNYNLGDLPLTGVAVDTVTGDVYVSDDFGVQRLQSGQTSWVMAGAGLPQVEVAGLSIAPGSRVLYAATHGRSAWKLRLP
jgi:hypothetical protein